MKSTTNVFLEGLRTDLHPLSTGQLYLTDALNATMITYNGNEMMLQNDMGNTLILDSATGNIMGLNPGFIPVGIKEHGGIMYIASVDKEGNGEIGTIPSPIIRDLYKDIVTLLFNNTSIPVDSGDPVLITNKLYPADKFIANLQMSINQQELKGIPHKKISELVKNDNDPCDVVLERLVVRNIANNKVKTTPLYSPIISYAPNSDSPTIIINNNPQQLTGCFKKGIYNLNLYALTEEGESTLASSLLSAQVYGDDGENKSQYWFLHTPFTTNVFPKDLFNATLNKDLKQVPVSNKPGKLAVKLITETITDFGMLPRAEEPYNTPITYKTTDGLYYTYFPGFYYTSDSGLYVEKLTARVIDESTNLPVDLEYPYNQEVSFGRYDLSGLTFKTAEETADVRFYNGDLKLWEINEWGLPHAYAQNNTSTNPFKTCILSPIAGLFNHEKTSFKSSTQNEDESAHSGLFRAVLGKNYNRWYRLEVDYEDQYGGNKGTFTTRFNPYLNDVFGVNLSIDSIENGQSMIIGEVLNYKAQTYNDDIRVTNLYTTSSSFALYMADIPSMRPDPSLLDGPGFSGGFMCLNMSNSSYYNSLITLSSANQNLTYSLSFDYEDDRFQLLNSNSRYIYSSTELNNIIDNTVEVTRTSDIEVSFRRTDHEGEIPMSKIWITSIWDSGSDYYENTTGWKTLYADYVTFATNNIDPDGNFIGKSVPLSNNIIFTNDTNIAPNFPLFNDSSCNIDNEYIDIDFSHSIDGDRLNIEAKPQNQINMRFNGLKGKNGVLNNAGFVKLYYITNDQRATLSRWGCEASLQASVKYTCPELTLNPLYRITPYFMLQGTKENNAKKTYVQRFKNLIFEHNFEEYSQFINDNGTNKISPCSYNEQLPFNYLCDPFHYKRSLGAGVYVLNIQKCPGANSLIQDNSDPKLTLTIQIGNVVYSYPDNDNSESIGKWTIDAMDTNNHRYKSSNKDYSIMEFYVPIVLVLPTSNVVAIDIVPKNNSEGTFNRLSIGLYKIKDVNGIDISTNLSLLTKHVYLYHDYMNVIANIAENNTSKTKQYNFIQKYGVFFKEAFVFVDGVYNNNYVNSITIGANKTYQPYPYIPSDPSILPVSLGANNNYYWNTYYMPEEVLNSDDCNFIFSNADEIVVIDDTVKSVKSGILRQLTKQE